MHLHNVSRVLQRNGVSLGKKNSLKANHVTCDEISEKGKDGSWWLQSALPLGVISTCSHVKCRTALNSSHFKCRDIYRGLSFALAFLTNGKKEERKLHSAIAGLLFIHSDYAFSTQAVNLFFPPAKKRRALSERIEIPCLWYFWSLPLMANRKHMQ